MKRLWFLLMLGFLVEGCATFPVEGWKRPANVLTDQQMQKDVLDCQVLATQAVGPPPNFGTVVWFADRNNAFELCMKSKGYVQ